MNKQQWNEAAEFAWRARAVDGEASELLFRELLAVDDTRADAWAAFGVVLAKNTREHEAVLAFEQSLRLQPNQIEVLCHHAELCMNLLRWADAHRSLKRCLELDPAASHAAGVRARALIKRAEKTLNAQLKQS